MLQRKPAKDARLDADKALLVPKRLPGSPTPRSSLHKRANRKLTILILDCLKDLCSSRGIPCGENEHSRKLQINFREFHEVLEEQACQLA